MSGTEGSTAPRQFASIPFKIGHADIWLNYLTPGTEKERNPMLEPVEAVCSHCGEPVGRQMAIFQTLVACDACREQAETDDFTSKCKALWAEICPVQYRETDQSHRDFPKALLRDLKRRWELADRPILLHGPSGTCKTRLGFELLKHALWKGKSVGVMWPWDLDEAKRAAQTAMLRQFGSQDVLLLDDCLLSGAHDERITSFLKNLIEFRLANKRPFILTSQIGAEDYKEAASRFDLRKSDAERIEAIMRRLGEVSIKVSTATVPDAR